MATRSGANVPLLSYFKAVIKVIVDFKLCWLEWKARRLLRDERVRGDPAGVKRRGGSPGRPRKAKRLERKSTVKFNRAIKKENMCPW